MLKDEITKKRIPAKDVYKYSHIQKGSIPLISLDAIADISFNNHDYKIQDNDIEEKYVILDFAMVNSDYLIRVKESSMAPKYNTGNILACNIIQTPEFIQWNKTHVLNTSQGVMIKRVNKSESDKMYILNSDNKNYPPFEVPKTSIRHMALVIGLVRLE